ncbi:MAG: hypothetical protein ACRDTC_12955 [Pseudonocardiaceae bacterium]
MSRGSTMSGLRRDTQSRLGKWAMALPQAPAGHGGPAFHLGW